VARIMPESERKTSNPVSFRLSPRAMADLEAIASESGLGRTAAVEAGISHLLSTLRRPTRTNGKRAIQADPKKSDRPS
jgi:hypothetical protein